MLNLDDFTKTVFDDIRDGVPIIGTDYPSNINQVGSFNDANGLASQYPVQNFSLPSFPSSAAIPNTMFPGASSDLSDGPSWDSVALRSFPRRPNHLGRTPQYVPIATPDPWTVNIVSTPSPPIAHTKRRMEGGGPTWYTSKCGRLDGMNAVERVPPSAYSETGFSEFLGTHDNIEGNALMINNYSTRTSDSEENFPVGGSAPVIEQSSAQGLWPTMTSTAASQRRPAWTPFMTAEYSGQPFPFPIDTRPSGAMPGTSAQITSMPATEYGFDFSWPSVAQQLNPSHALPWGHTHQAPRRPVQIHRDEMSFLTPGPSSFPGLLGSWPSSAVETDAFPSIPTPSMAAGDAHDSSLAPVVQQHFDQDRPMVQRSRRARGQRQSRQTRRTSVQSSQSLPSPVAESSSSSVSQASSSSSVSDGTSTPAPKKKGKRNAQMPYLLAKAKCHLCREGFNRGSELHDHLKTNKHRLRELEAENPGVIVTVDALIPNCFCPSCGKGYTTPYIVTRHLKKCRGRVGSSQSGSQD